MRDVPKPVLSWKKKIADALRERGHEKASERVRDCSQIELLLCCENCGHKKYVTYKCQARVCPICSWQLARTRARFSEALLKQMKYPKFLTLTMPTWTGDPREGIKFLREGFSKLRSREIWKNVKGGCYQIELKPKENGWHIHIHVLMDAPYLAKQKLFSAWRDILNLPYASIDIRAAKSERQKKYITKYAVKEADFNGDASAVVDWYEAVKGSRIFGTFGQWYNTRIEELLNSEEFEVFKPVCEWCGDPDHMFYARDGPFIFGKSWVEICTTFVGDWAVSRPIEAVGDRVQLAFEIVE